MNPAHNAAFHQGLPCSLRDKNNLQRQIFFQILRPLKIQSEQIHAYCINIYDKIPWEWRGLRDGVYFFFQYQCYVVLLWEEQVLLEIYTSAWKNNVLMVL